MVHIDDHFLAAEKLLSLAHTLIPGQRATLVAKSHPYKRTVNLEVSNCLLTIGHSQSPATSVVHHTTLCGLHAAPYLSSYPDLPGTPRSTLRVTARFYSSWPLRPIACTHSTPRSAYAPEPAATAPSTSLLPSRQRATDLAREREREREMSIQLLFKKPTL